MIGIDWNQLIAFLQEQIKNIPATIAQLTWVAVLLAGLLISWGSVWDAIVAWLERLRLSRISTHPAQDTAAPDHLREAQVPDQSAADQAVITNRTIRRRSMRGLDEFQKERLEAAHVCVDAGHYAEAHGPAWDGVMNGLERKFAEDNFVALKRVRPTLKRCCTIEEIREVLQPDSA